LEETERSRRAAAAAAAQTFLGQAPDTVERALSSGRNSGVWQVHAQGARYALKLYPPHQAGERDRAACEYAALRFLTEHGIAAVPRPVACDSRLGATLLEWIDGESVPDPCRAEIVVAGQFIDAIHGLRGAEDARALPPAAEACLSGSEILRQTAERLARLTRLRPKEPELATFLAGTLEPLRTTLARWAETGCEAAGLAFGRPLAAALTTLCPADFGFHNALRRSSGDLAFLDFDYFGWDDPVKLVADFLWHPAMSLGNGLKRQFVATALATYGDDPSFARRLSILYPLFGLRWCAILLNEFLPERWARRVHAGEEGDWTALKRRQLDRAGEWAQSLAATFRRFPYGE
jgi:Phosphotransferase enzyme family